MKKIILLALTITFNMHASLLPPNDLDKQILKSNGMTEERFNQIIEKFERIYTPIIKKRGGKFVIQKMWNVNEVNASARRFYPLFSLTIMGGLARHPLVTEDALMLTLCHETGHLLGSAPRKKNIINRWASVEGQADYFTTLKCARRVWEKDDNERIINQMQVNEYIDNICEESFTIKNKIAICKRGLMASISIAKLMESIRNDGPIDIMNRDTEVVAKTKDDHPSSQCRLDTFLSGAICEIDLNIELSKNNVNIGTCNRKSGHTNGVRPLCWYKP